MAMNNQEYILGINAQLNGSEAVIAKLNRINESVGSTLGKVGSIVSSQVGYTKSGADIIKVGLKGPNSAKDAIYLMRKVVKTVREYNEDIKIVVAGYADRIRMESSPEFMSIPTIASESSSDIAMLDTFIKDEKGLFDFLSFEQLIQFKNKAHEYDLEVALAGNLRKKNIPLINDISPDIIGVRTVVCEGYDRNNGIIKAKLIEELKTELYKK